MGQLSFISCSKSPIMILRNIKDEIDRLLYGHKETELIKYLRSLRAKDIYQGKECLIDYDTIIRKVFDYYNLRIGNHNLRNGELKTARQVSIFFGKRYTFLTYKQLGEPFKKDHATCIHSIKVVNNLIDTDKKFANEIMNIEDIILNGQREYEMIECNIN